MLSCLFGSKNAERILLFLLVNESCYVSELQKAFGVSLAPLQNIFQKFEKAGIVIFEHQGNKKLFRLNPSYPLYQELKGLIKAAFVHLPSSEKKLLFSQNRNGSFSSQESFARQKSVAQSLRAFWKRLEKVENMSIQTQSGGQGFGKVIVSREKENVLLFTEQGEWAHEEAQGIHFNKALRWTIDYAAGMISLEHLHYGPNRPVFLFHMTPTGPKSLQSVDSHLCLSDCYFGRVTFNNNNIEFLWRILGPRKNEVLYHVYS